MQNSLSGTQDLELSQDGRRDQLRRVLLSAQFQNAPLLRGFLEFAATAVIEGRVSEINEYAIATRVFGRREDFDPTSATIVRTQAYRLRKKLHEYYETAGANDPLVIGIPKGHYVPEFLPRGKKPATPEVSPVRERRQGGLILGAALVAAVVFIAGYGLGRANRPSAAPTLTPALSRFWSAFAASGRPVIIGYTNPVFFITENGDLLQPDGGALGNRGEMLAPNRRSSGTPNPLLRNYMGPLYYEDGFTGSGEVIAAQHLAGVLNKAGVPFIVKRSRMVTVDDLRNNDVVFLGSQSAYQALDGIKLFERFDFQRPKARPLLWRMQIVDRLDQSRVFQLERDPGTQVLKTDYAIFASLPGIVPGRRIVILGGIGTSGTQGAAEFATTEHHMSQLDESLSKSGSAPAFFEAVLRVETAKGLDAVKSALVAAAPHAPAR